jgi:hypothetical protein
MNIAKEDLIGLSGLSEEEVAAIAEHEHIPDVAAAALANYLAGRKGGIQEVRHMICDDIKSALDRGHDRHAAELFMALTHLHQTYGEELAKNR